LLKGGISQRHPFRYSEEGLWSNLKTGETRNRDGDGQARTHKSLEWFGPSEHNTLLSL
jgi:hypothetical protein